MAELFLVEAVNDALHVELERDETVMVMGQQRCSKPKPLRTFRGQSSSILAQFREFLAFERSTHFRFAFGFSFTRLSDIRSM